MAVRHKTVLKIPCLKKMTTLLGLILWLMMMMTAPGCCSSSWQDNVRPIMYVQLGKRTFSFTLQKSQGNLAGQSQLELEMIFLMDMSKRIFFAVEWEKPVARKMYRFKPGWLPYNDFQKEKVITDC